MVLFQDVVHVWGPAASAPATQIARPFQLVDSSRVCRVAVDIDQARLDAPGLRDRKLEEALGRDRIPIR
jgi:hypothetical protein